ncbi:MAG: Heat shock protein Hsp20 family [Verrucomicrobiales bacterium]|nr:Heat shock protein Hsp20 family [Verrucomicrobiales bacterium]
MKLSTLSTWNPARELDELVHRFSKFLGQLPLGQSRSGNGTGESLTLVDWIPPVDITEDPKSYSIKMDMPEVSREDVKVTVKNGALEITGERKAAKEEKDETQHRVERISGTFTRIFTLPEDVEASGVKAECRDGVLRVTLPKSAQASPKQLNVPVQ